MGTTNMTLAVLLAKLRYEESMLKATAQADPVGLVMQYLPARDGEDLKALMVQAKRARENDADQRNQKMGKFAEPGDNNPERKDNWGRLQGRDAYSQRNFQGRGAQGSRNFSEMGQGRGPQNQRGDSGRDMRQCYNCLQYGHIQRFCKNPRALFAAALEEEAPAVSEQL